MSADEKIDRERLAALEDELRTLRAPAESEARERALTVTRAALAERRSELEREGAGGRLFRPRLPRDPRPAIAAVIAAAIAALLLTPAGASVRDWIEDAIESEPAPRTEPLKLPAPGSILTSNDGGTWVATQGGSIRRLGAYRQAAFSPRGLNYAVASGRMLAAVNAEGDLQWKLATPGRVADPTWAPSGIRIAYMADRSLRLIDGNGENDRLYARRVEAVAPAWRPATEGETPRDILAWSDGAGAVRIADVVSGAEPTTIRPNGRVIALEWLADGRLAAATSRELAVYSLTGERQSRFRQPSDARITDLAADPSDERLALARTQRGEPGGNGQLVLARVEPGKQRESVLFSGPGRIDGIAFAPDGSWIGFGWPPADSWLFARPRENTKLLSGVEAAPEISARFSAGADGLIGPGFPAIVDWCC